MAAHENPHILIEAEIGLTEWLWDMLAEKPYVLSSTPAVSKIRNERATMVAPPAPHDGDEDDRDLYVRRLRLLPLVNALLKDEADHDGAEAGALKDFYGVLDDVRGHFGLAASAPLKVVVVGSHSSIGDYLKACYAMGDPEAEGFGDWWPRRQLAARLGMALERAKGVRLIWLAEAAPELRPVRDPPDLELVDLAATVRKRLAGDEFVSETGRRLFIPLIYVREDSRLPWRPFETLAGYRQFTTTLELIREFKRARNKIPGLAGVLVKVLADDASPQNMVDAPMLTPKQRSEAKEAQLMILLDRRFGTVCPGEPGDELVYAV